MRQCRRSRLAWLLPTCSDRSCPRFRRPSGLRRTPQGLFWGAAHARPWSVPAREPTCVRRSECRHGAIPTRRPHSCGVRGDLGHLPSTERLACAAAADGSAPADGIAPASSACPVVARGTANRLWAGGGVPAVPRRFNSARCPGFGQSRRGRRASALGRPSSARSRYPSTALSGRLRKELAQWACRSACWSSATRALPAGRPRYGA